MSRDTKMALSISPCAACKLLRRRCSQECVFAPHFPPEQPARFAYLHKVFGASNVSKLLNDLPPNHREDAVNSLFYEAEARLRDPVYGCVGLISILQHRHKQLRHEIHNARKELATYVGPQAMLPIIHSPQTHFLSPPPQPLRPSSSSSASVRTHQQQRQHHQHEARLFPMMAIQPGELYEQQQQQFYEAQQLAAVAREHQIEMLRAYGGGGNHHQNQTQVDISRFNNGFDSVPAGSVTITGFNQVNGNGTTVTGMSPSLTLGGNFVDSPSTNGNYHADHHQQQHHYHHLQQQHHHEAQFFTSTQSLQPPPPLQTHESQTQSDSESEECRRNGSSR